MIVLNTSALSLLSDINSITLTVPTHVHLENYFEIKKFNKDL